MYQTAKTNWTATQGYEVVYSSCTDRTERCTEVYSTFKHSSMSVAFYHLYALLSKYFSVILVKFF